VFKRLRITDPAKVLREIREGMTSLAANGASAAPPDQEASKPATASHREIRYLTLSSESYDPLADLLEGMNLSAHAAPGKTASGGGTVLVNCLEATAAQVLAYSAGACSEDAMLLGSVKQFGQHVAKQIVRLPNSYSNLRAACEQAIV
jgi:hypothetical protein